MQRFAPLHRSQFPFKSKAKGGMLAAGAGLALVGTAAYVAWAAREAEVKHPPGGHFIDVDGVHVHYIAKGDENASVIVLLHGNGSMASDFEGSGLLGALANNHRVVAFDRPGFGYSERPRGRKWDATEQAKLIASAMQHLAITEAVIVGHSWGTLCAMALALETPHLVRRLVLISGYYYPTPRADTALLGMPAIPIIGDVMRYTTSAIASRLVLGKLLGRMFAPQEVPSRFTTQVPRALLLRPSQLRAGAEESLMMNDEAERLAPRYRDIPHLITLLAGDQDGVVNTQEQSARLHDELPKSKLQIVERAGHMLHYAATLTVITAIEDAIKAGQASTIKNAGAVQTPAVDEKGVPGIATPS